MAAGGAGRRVCRPPPAPAPDGLSPALDEAFGQDEARPVPAWIGRSGSTAPGQPGTAAAPVLTVEHSEPTTGGRRVRARLYSPRGADRAVVMLPSKAVASATVEGQPVATGSDHRGRLMLFGLPAEGVELTLDLRGGPIEATVVDCVAGLPDSAASLAAARDTDAVPVQWGDTACVATRASL